jgi:hypothetical protein
MNGERNSKNYQIFSANPKTDGMKAAPYSDRFTRHHIPFSYRLPYLPNNTKMTKKYEKIKPVFPKILSTIFTLTYTYRLDSINMTMTCQTIGPALERTHRSSPTPSRAHRPKHISLRFIS